MAPCYEGIEKPRSRGPVPLPTDNQAPAGIDTRSARARTALEPRRPRMRFDALTLFGLFAVTAMLLCCALERKSRRYILGSSIACVLGSIHGRQIHRERSYRPERREQHVRLLLWASPDLADTACMTTPEISGSAGPGQVRCTEFAQNRIDMMFVLQALDLYWACLDRTDDLRIKRGLSRSLRL
jgi:hypothetical protein